MGEDTGYDAALQTTNASEVCLYDSNDVFVGIAFLRHYDTCCANITYMQAEDFRHRFQ